MCVVYVNQLKVPFDGFYLLYLLLPNRIKIVGLFIGFKNILDKLILRILNYLGTKVWAKGIKSIFELISPYNARKCDETNKKL